MSPHVSQLVLDELASELPVAPEAKAHVESCADCGAKLQATKRARTQSMQSFGWSRTKARVAVERPPRWRELMPFIFPLIAGAIFFAVIWIDWGKKDDTRLKGGASIAFVRSGAPVIEAKPGERLQLEVGSAGHSHAMVLAVDKDRHVDVLWEGKLPPGAIVTLPKEVEVTPGSVVVHVFLGDAPLEAKVIVPAMQAAIAEYAGWPLEAPPPKIGGVTVATQKLHVTQ